jgi:hypothetical protein
LKRLILIAVAVVLFLLISGLLARFFSVQNAERDDEEAYVQAQVKGNERGMLAQLSDCTGSSCRAIVHANASDLRLRRHGAVKILQIESPTAYSLTATTGVSRLAWTVIGTLPVVQCVTVRRTGNFLSGITLELLSVSKPIPNENDC